LKLRRRGRACSTYVQEEEWIQILVRKPEEKRPLGRTRRRWEDNIKMGLREIRWDGMDWIHLVQDRYQWRALVNTVMNLRVAGRVGRFMSS
jgi:hypothetical protein